MGLDQKSIWKACMYFNFKNALTKIPSPREAALAVLDAAGFGERLYGRRIGGYTSFSQAFQDVFVLEMLNKKQKGYYVEIGSNDPVGNSNTYCLEKYYGWTGVSVEMDVMLAKKFNSKRKSVCLNTDATKFNYAEYFKEKSLPTQIDYLQLDIEPANNTYAALNMLPLDEYRFSVITYEHDNYSYGAEYMHKSRALLSARGYKLIVPNVKFNGMDFEDWWVDPAVIPEESYGKYLTNISLECREIFKF